MAVEQELKPGQTPPDHDEAANLRPRHISTQGELDSEIATSSPYAQRILAITVF